MGQQEDWLTTKGRPIDRPPLVFPYIYEANIESQLMLNLDDTVKSFILDGLEKAPRSRLANPEE